MKKKNNLYLLAAVLTFFGMLYVAKLSIIQQSRDNLLECFDENNNVDLECYLKEVVGKPYIDPELGVVYPIRNTVCIIVYGEGHPRFTIDFYVTGAHQDNLPSSRGHFSVSSNDCPVLKTPFIYREDALKHHQDL